jgi:hypothetical protein
MLSPRYRLMIQQDGRIRLLIETFLYTTVVLADNETFSPQALVTSALGRQLLADRAGGPGPSARPRPTMAGATKLIATSER